MIKFWSVTKLQKHENMDWTTDIGDYVNNILDRKNLLSFEKHIHILLNLNMLTTMLIFLKIVNVMHHY